ncbi:type VI secretion system tube protein Hcp [uncultured Roseobacter sp.]|uniref:Hcp family type VI secretion system effector n=1 Tax=uncultured Roseobacter sp. TaxID=114847 RepID=UPI00260B04A4|nr:type VI secretion system tube protein Hcp [uncultured Roseobacter sp.]
MPLTGYLKIDDIPGESQRVDHEDEIDVWGVSWGIEQQSSAVTSRLRRRGRAEIDPVVVHKQIDAATPYLADAVERGRVFREMTLAVRKDSGEAHLDYLVITMENVLITSFSFAEETRDGGSVVPAERVALEADRMTVKYVRLNDDHSAHSEHEVEIGR